jgi:xyloglucan-specific exo-beta-1,4-glucanase
VDTRGARVRGDLSSADRLRGGSLRARLTAIGLVAAVTAGVNAASVATAPTAAAASTGYTWGNAEVVGGGFVPGIILSQTEKNLAYARTDIGGAYRLDNATQRCAPAVRRQGCDLGPDGPAVQDRRQHAGARPG